MDTVAEIKRICKEKNITISKLEKDLGFSNGYISQLRRGVVRADRLSAIADYLGVSLASLLGEEETQPEEITSQPNSDMNEMLTSIKENPGMRILFNKAKNATPEQLLAIAQMIDTFKQGG